MDFAVAEAMVSLASDSVIYGCSMAKSGEAFSHS